jgi:hypothetical protein
VGSSPTAPTNNLTESRDSVDIATKRRIRNLQIVVALLVTCLALIAAISIARSSDGQTEYKGLVPSNATGKEDLYADGEYVGTIYQFRNTNGSYNWQFWLYKDPKGEFKPMLLR